MTIFFKKELHLTGVYSIIITDMGPSWVPFLFRNRNVFILSSPTCEDSACHKEGKTLVKWARLLPGLLLLALFSTAAAVLAWKISDYLIDEKTSLDYWEELQDAVAIRETAPPPTGKAEPTPAPKEDGQAEAEPEPEPTEPDIPAAIDFNALREISGNAVAWLYAPGMNINYVVAQSGDNAYYLRRLLDGTYASGGSLFTDYRCSADFSDWNTVIYGHQMNNGTMFGELANYRDPAYYAEHPVMYLYVPGKRYTLELIAGYTTDVYDTVYSLPATKGDRDEILDRAARKSSFVSGVTAGEEDKLVTLSTCAYDYANARNVLISRIVEDGMYQAERPEGQKGQEKYE